MIAMNASPPAESRLYQRQDGLLAASVDDEVLMMSVELGAYFSLNPVGARIWELLETPHDFAALTAILTAEYDAEAEVIRSETRAFLTRLENEGLLKPATETGL